MRMGTSATPQSQVIVGAVAAVMIVLAGASLAPRAAAHEPIARGARTAGGTDPGSYYRGTSADGSRVFFVTPDRLVAGDTDTVQDVYERSGGTTRRVSAGAINGNGAFPASYLGASADGTRVFFYTQERLASGDTDASYDVYERSGGVTKRISAGAINGNGPFNVTDFAVPKPWDGTRVYFETAEPLAPGDTDTQVDIYERSGAATTLVSAGAINGNGAFFADFYRASADGARVLFWTREQLVASDTDTYADVYERSGGTTKLVSAGAINGNGAFGAYFVGSSADLSRVFFATAEPLVAADTDSVNDVYERSLGTTKLVSGGAINGNGPYEATARAVSTDGSRIFFVTQERLVGDDVDFGLDVYERSGGTTKRISVGAINGNGAFHATFGGASADGTRVIFETDERLVSGDTDTQVDVYERAGAVTRRISAGAINGNGAFRAYFTPTGMSGDGTRVFFSTRERLVSADTDAQDDVYERSGGTTKLATAGAINGNGAFAAYFEAISTDGTRFFFETDERLVSGDADAQFDVYQRSGGTTTLVSRP